MQQNSYVGHELQIRGVEEHTLVGGKGGGMRLLEVRNGLGLEFTAVVDRCADISRLTIDGVNASFISPCGYVAPSFYEGTGNGFLKSFTAGFLTTCGLDTMGATGMDEGESMPLHGPIGNIPAEHIYWYTEEKGITIRARIRQASLFSHHYMLEREYFCPFDSNEIRMTDTVTNIGPSAVPFMLLYHYNLGYPLLSEKADVRIPSKQIRPRDEETRRDLENWNRMEVPQSNYIEKCFYHDFDIQSEQAFSGVYNPDCQKGVVMEYSPRELPAFSEWKMMGKYEYVLGLEPGTNNPDGRATVRKQGKLRTLQPGERSAQTIVWHMCTSSQQFERFF